MDPRKWKGPLAGGTSAGNGVGVGLGFGLGVGVGTGEGSVGRGFVGKDVGVGGGSGFVGKGEGVEVGAGADPAAGTTVMTSGLENVTYDLSSAKLIGW